MWLPLQRPPLSAGIFCNLGKRPDWELNQRPFGQQAGAQSPEPHLLGPRLCSLMTHGQGAAHRDLSSAGCLGLPTPPGPRAERWAPPLQDCLSCSLTELSLGSPRTHRKHCLLPPLLFALKAKGAETHALLGSCPRWARGA